MQPETFVSERWCAIDEFPVDERTDAWQMALSAGYNDWTVNERVPADFTARIRQRDIGGIRLVECACSPCHGKRTAQEIKRDEEPYLGIQLTFGGQEHFNVGDGALSFGAGALFLWTSNQPCEFVVTQALHKATLMIPFAVLQERLPKNLNIRGAVIDSRAGLGAILFSHIQSLTDQFSNLHAVDSGCLKRVTLELVASTLAGELDKNESSLSERYLRAVQAYILDHLHEEDLSLNRIAQANRISVRYLHMIFKQSGKSASNWIQQQRLDRCRDALLDPAYADRNVSEIAYQWGFNDASHFSRLFKLHFGQSPNHFRKSQYAH